MLAASFSSHESIYDYSWSKDSELDAAQILSGVATVADDIDPGLRFCFQTTYLNERYVEYEKHIGSYFLIWLLRNPHSVVYSMLHNWSRFALDEVFLSCGRDYLTQAQTTRLNRFGVFGVKPIYRACYAYLGKLKQCEELLTTLPPESMRTVEYEVLVSDKTRVMNSLYDFTQLARQPETGETIHTRSLKKADKLSAKHKSIVEALCSAPYERLRSEQAREL